VSESGGQVRDRISRGRVRARVRVRVRVKASTKGAAHVGRVGLIREGAQGCDDSTERQPRIGIEHRHQRRHAACRLYRCVERVRGDVAQSARRLLEW
tara:strand:+ start:260 stop:550 length:291 start_codon:yes stop_codon:yes gene_type:complete